MVTKEDVEALAALMAAMREHGATHLKAGQVELTLGPALQVRTVHVPAAPGEEAREEKQLVTPGGEEHAGLDPNDPLFDHTRGGAS